MAADIKTKAELDAAFKPGWSLEPNKLNPGYTLQEGKPGCGGKAKSVTSRAVNAFLKDHAVRRVGAPFRWHYVRQDKV